VTEIRFDVDLEHPPARVWRALTDPRELSEWFLPADFDPADRARVRLHPHQFDGFTGPLDMEVVAAEAPHRFVTRWQGDELHVRVVITIAGSGTGGSRLTFVQRGFLGRRGTLRRRVLRGTYRRLFAERLPRALDRMAGQEPTVAIPVRQPPGNAGPGGRLATRRNDGGFRGRRVRRAELRDVPAGGASAGPPLTRGVAASDTAGYGGRLGIPQSIVTALRPASPRPRLAPPEESIEPPTGEAVAVAGATGRGHPGTAHRSPEAARRSPGSAYRAGGSARGVAAVGPGATAPAATGPVATGRAAVPSTSAWLAAQPAGRRHRAVAVPYRHGGGRSIRRFVAVRPVSEEPTRPLHAAGARRRRDVVSHSAAPARLVLGDIRTRLGSVWGWAVERRSQVATTGAALLLVIAVSAVVAARMAEPAPAGAPQMGGAAEPPPGFAPGPGQAGRTGAAGRSSAAPGAPTVAGRSPSPSGTASAAVGGPAPGALTATYRAQETWNGGYRGEVSIGNPTEAGVDGWTVTVTLPLPGLTVSAVRGAQVEQRGRVVTFIPTGDTRSLAPRGSVRFDFAVDGAGQPTGCTVNGRPCDGLAAIPG
jgi:uncharacterized protein YndB with AHSA1/START domain